MFKWIKEKLNLDKKKNNENESENIKKVDTDLESDQTEKKDIHNQKYKSSSTIENLQESSKELKENSLAEDLDKNIAKESVINTNIDSSEKVEKTEPIKENLKDNNKDKINTKDSKDSETNLNINKEDIDKKNKKPNFFQKLVSGLTKTRDQMTEKIDDILASYHKIDEDLFYDLEEALVVADVGVETTMRLIDGLKERVQKGRVTDPNEVKELLKEEIKDVMKESVESNELTIEPSPAVILVVGVNGVGKTTTIGKLSNSLKEDGKKVLMAAGDTFRAAAIEQLEEWSNRSGVEIISHSEGADPGAVIFDGIHAAKARKTDVLICDTAGRLHNKANLMNELGKIFKILEREYPEATKEVLLVLDATTGQNAINQAKTFKEVANITGVALTKLDGTAKGGVVIALQAELGLPVKLIGVGEGIYDLQPFNTDDFVDALFN